MPSKTFDQYADELKDVLDAAESAVRSTSEPKMARARDTLRAFVESSNDLVPGVIELDNVAANARRDIVLVLLGSALEADIGSRTDEVSRLVKRFSSQAATNNSQAAALRLERVRALTDASLLVVSELKKFNEQVDASTPDGRRIAKAIQSAIDAVSAVRAQVSA